MRTWILGAALGIAALMAAYPTHAALRQDEALPGPAPRTWERVPQTEFPVRARRAGVTYGEVTLDCRVRYDRRVDRCLVVSETPEGLGFGASVIRAVRSGRLSVAGATQAVDDRIVWTTRLRD